MYYVKLKDASAPLYILWSDNVGEETYSCYKASDAPFDAYSTHIVEFKYSEVIGIDTNPYALPNNSGLQLKCTRDRVEVVGCPHGGVHPITIIAFNTIMGEWYVGTSMCLPSKMASAKIVKAAYDMAFDEMERRKLI